jgi:hypothetical protein
VTHVNDGTLKHSCFLEEGEQNRDAKRDGRQSLGDGQQQVNELLGHAEQNERPGGEQSSLRVRAASLTLTFSPSIEPG